MAVDGALYDIGDPRKPDRLSTLPSADGSRAYPTPRAFSPDGRLLTGVGSGTRLLAWDVWDPTAPHPVATLTLDDEARALGVSADGATLTTYNYPGQAVRWNIARLDATLRDPVARACRLAAANPAFAEWERMAPGVPFRSVCPTLTPAPSPPPPRTPSRPASPDRRRASNRIPAASA